MNTVFRQAPPPKRTASPGLIKLLERLGFATNQELETLARSSSTFKIIHALALSKQLDEAAIVQAIAEQLKLEVFSDLPKNRDVRVACTQLSTLLSKDLALASRAAPLRRQEHAIVFAVADPLDTETMRELEFTIGSSVAQVVASEELILKLIDMAFIDANALPFDSDTDAPELRGAVEISVAEDSGPDTSEDSLAAPPIVKLVNKILLDAAGANASDIHLEPTATDLEVRFRVDGMLRHYLTIPKRLQPYILARIKLLSHMDITEKRKPQDGRFRIRSEALATRDVRVSAVPTPFGETIVLRLLRPDTTGLDFNYLGMPEDLQQLLGRVLSAKDRLFIVTGPTGSGKSTTLYGAINHIKEGALNIVTVEDPIEFRIHNATQIQVDPKVGVTFATGLRSILRQDPDVILVGEIRDLETAEIAFQAAQTGHLVLTTLHTNDAPSAIVRLRDLGLDPTIMAPALGGVLAQRLVRRNCPHCSKPLTPAEAEKINNEYDLPTAAMRIGTGCRECDNTGFKGRVGIFSYLPIDEKIRYLIRDRASEEEIVAAARPLGFNDLAESACRLVVEGTTTFPEIERVLGMVSKKARNLSPKNEHAAISVSSGIRQPVSEPAQPEEQTGSVADLASSYLASDKSEARRPRILMIDDDHGVRAVMAKSLRRADFDVFEAANGNEALERLKSFTPDAIVCDIEMPQLDGRELVVKLKADEHTKTIPILMLTGLDAEDSELSLIEMGANDFVSKSSSPAVVIARLKRLLT